MKTENNIGLLENPESCIERVLDIYKKLFRISDGNLDQYVSEELLNIENSSLEKHSDELQAFLDMASKLYADQKSEILMNKLKEISQNHKCALFLKWLNGYAESMSYIIKETLFIRGMDLCEFEKMAEFCMQNFVLQNVGEYVAENDWDKEKLRTLKNVIYTAAELRIGSNLSEKYAEEIMYEKLYLDAKYSEVILRTIDIHYEQIWRIIFIRRQKSIDEKLDQILRKQL